MMISAGPGQALASMRLRLPAITKTPSVISLSKLLHFTIYNSTSTSTSLTFWSIMLCSGLVRDDQMLRGFKLVIVFRYCCSHEFDGHSSLERSPCELWC